MAAVEKLNEIVWPPRPIPEHDVFHFCFSALSLVRRGKVDDRTVFTATLRVLSDYESSRTMGELQTTGPHILGVWENLDEASIARVRNEVDKSFGTLAIVTSGVGYPEKSIES